MEHLNNFNIIASIQNLYENFFDLESFLNDLYGRFDYKTFNINHVFQVKNIRHALVIFKSSMTRHIIKKNYNKDNAYSGS